MRYWTIIRIGERRPGQVWESMSGREWARDLTCYRSKREARRVAEDGDAIVAIEVPDRAASAERGE